MRVTFDKTKDTHVCSIHGEVDYVGWVPCWTGCDEGYVDEYENDPINEDPDTFSVCPECKGKGGFTVCGECNADNPDVEW